MKDGNPEEKKPAAPEETRENGEKPGEGLNCPCFGERHREERSRKRTPWTNFDL